MTIIQQEKGEQAGANFSLLSQQDLISSSDTRLRNSDCYFKQVIENKLNISELFCK